MSGRRDSQRLSIAPGPPPSLRVQPDRARILGVVGIADSLIGRDVEVTRSGSRPRALRLMLGDHSKIDLE